MGALERQRKPRYEVRDESGEMLRATDSRLMAWWTWFRRRRQGATAHDRLSWVVDERSWLRSEGCMTAGAVHRHHN